MLLSPYVADLIQNGRTDEIKAVTAKSVEIGMATFDQSLYGLYVRGDITHEQAIEHADSQTDLSLRMRLAPGSRPDTEAGAARASALTVSYGASANWPTTATRTDA